MSFFGNTVAEVGTINASTQDLKMLDGHSLVAVTVLDTEGDCKVKQKIIVTI